MRREIKRDDNATSLAHILAAMSSKRVSPASIKKQLLGKKREDEFMEPEKAERKAAMMAKARERYRHLDDKRKARASGD